MNETVMTEELFGSEGFYNNNSDERKMLIMDSFSGHLTDQVKKVCKDNNTDVAIIPGGYTSILQPLDIGIIKPFKDSFRKKWNHWMLNNVYSTDNINIKIKKPEYIEVCKWVCAAWEGLKNSPCIINSYRRAFGN